MNKCRKMIHARDISFEVSLVDTSEPALDFIGLNSLNARPSQRHDLRINLQFHVCANCVWVNNLWESE